MKTITVTIIADTLDEENETYFVDLSNPTSAVISDGTGIGVIVDDDTSDVDGDGIPDAMDNCVNNPNPDQVDEDADGLGDACDQCPLDPENDYDGDGLCGDVDPCPHIPNFGQVDEDCDGMHDACEPPDLTDNDCDAIFIPFGDGNGMPGEFSVVFNVGRVFPFTKFDIFLPL